MVFLSIGVVEDLLLSRGKFAELKACSDLKAVRVYRVVVFVIEVVQRSDRKIDLGVNQKFLSQPDEIVILPCFGSFVVGRILYAAAFVLSVEIKRAYKIIIAKGLKAGIGGGDIVTILNSIAVSIPVIYAHTKCQVGFEFVSKLRRKIKRKRLCTYYIEVAANE